MGCTWADAMCSPGDVNGLTGGVDKASQILRRVGRDLFENVGWDRATLCSLGLGRGSPGCTSKKGKDLSDSHGRTKRLAAVPNKRTFLLHCVFTTCRRGCKLGSGSQYPLCRGATWYGSQDAPAARVVPLSCSFRRVLGVPLLAGPSESLPQPELDAALI